MDGHTSEHGEPVPFRHPSILMGMDMSYVAEQFTNFAVGAHAGRVSVPSELDPDKIKQESEAARLIPKP